MKNRLGYWLDHAAHFAAVLLSVTAAFLLRFDFSLPQGIGSVLSAAVWIALLVKLPAFDVAGIHRGLRQFASIPDLYRVLVGNLAASALFVIASFTWIGPAMPRSVWVIDGLLCFVLTALIRFSVRIRSEAFSRER